MHHRTDRADGALLLPILNCDPHHIGGVIGITGCVRRPLYNLPIGIHMDVIAHKEFRMRWPAKMAVVGYIGLIALVATVAGSQMGATKVSPCPDHTASQAIQQDTTTDHPACAPVDVVFVDADLELFKDLP